MQYQTFRLSSKQRLFAIVCIVFALLLLGAALFEPKHSAQKTWIPLNGAVEAALNELEGLNEAAETLDITQSAETPQAVETPKSVQTTETAENETVSQPGADEALHDEIETTADKAALRIVEADTGLLDLNRASALELQALKGIGPSKAQAIIDERERNGHFKNVDDLLRVKGIGEKLLAGIKESVVARP